MAFNSVLNFVSTACANDEIGKTAEACAALDLHLDVVLVDVPPPLRAYAYGVSYGGVAYADDWKNELDAKAASLKKRASEIEKVLGKHGPSARAGIEFCDHTVMEETANLHTWSADVALFTGTEEMPKPIHDAVLAGVLFNSPIGALCGAGARSLLGGAKKPMLAWDASAQAAIAAHKALPLLLKAGEADVIMFDPVRDDDQEGEEPGADIAAWLTRHNISVEVHQEPGGGQEVSKNLLRMAKELGSDVIVMGAYGHSRLRQRIFGGTTRSMLSQDDVPVFLSH